MSYTPNNLSLLSVTGAKVSINSLKYKHLEFFCVGFPIPGMNLPEATASYRGHYGYLPGDKISYSDITFKVLMDEDLRVFEEVTNWIRNIHSTNVVDKEDIILHIYNNAKIPNREFKLFSAFPTGISQIDTSVQEGDITYPTVDVTFRYDRFELKPKT